MGFFVMGAILWLVIASLYVLAVLGLAWGAAVLRRRDHGRLFRGLAALVAALVFAPPACVALYVPLYTENEELIKPRLIDDLVTAYAIPFALLLCGALAVCFLFRRDTGHQNQGR